MQQSKERAAQIREAGKKEEELIKSKLIESIEKKHQAEKEFKLAALHKKYEEGVFELGSAHQKAEKEVSFCFLMFILSICE